MPDPSSTPSRKPWPPPPDLHSIQELVALGDVDGFIAEGAPPDEYESEADDLFESIRHLTTDELVVDNLSPILEAIWQESFKLGENDLVAKRPKLHELARQIERFFGPEARPQVRGS